MNARLLAVALLLPMAGSPAEPRGATPPPQRVEPLIARGIPVSGPAGLAIDLRGDVYLAATLFSGSGGDFDGHRLSTTGDGDAFVARYDGNGRAAWVRGFGDKEGNPQYATGAAVTADGTVAIIGTFSGSLQVGSRRIEGSRQVDFLAALDAGTGEGRWALRFDEGEQGALTAIAANPADKSGNVAVCGRASAPATELVPGARFGGGKSDLVIAVFDRAGKRIWAKQLGGPGEEDCDALAVADDGDVYAAGRYNEALSFTGPLPKPDSPNARWLWLARFDGRTGAAKAQTAFAGFQAMPRALAIAGEVVAIGGSFVRRLAIEPRAALASAGASDAFVAVLTVKGAGFRPRWSVRLGAEASDTTNGLAFTSGGDLVATGSFAGTTSGAAALTAAGLEAADLFVLLLDGRTGATRSAAGYGDRVTQAGDAVAVNRRGEGAARDRVAIAGTLDGAIEFPPPAGTVRATGTGEVVLLLGKLK